MYVAKNGNLIVLANNSREALEEQLQFIVYTTIEETEENYTLYNGEYLTDDEVAEKYKQELVEFNYKTKAGRAYGGVIINNEYVFETNETSQSLITASIIGLQSQPETATLNWKVYKDNQPVIITITKAQLTQLFAFAMVMINSCFGVEGQRNALLETATTSELNDATYRNLHKEGTIFAMSQINNEITLTLVE